MNYWIIDFVSRCLKGIPEGGYRNRAEKELRDHLLSLERDLEQAGYAPEQAQTLAVARMGDPAELSRHYVREWRRRAWTRRLFVGLFVGEIFLFALCVCATGFLYSINERNFGKQWVGDWGFVAGVVAIIIAASVVFGASDETWTEPWAVTRRFCQIFAVIQLPPIYFWNFYYEGAFEMSGVMVPGWAGLSVHVFFLLWALVHYGIASQLQHGRITLGAT